MRGSLVLSGLLFATVVCSTATAQCVSCGSDADRGCRVGDEIVEINGSSPVEAALRCKTWQEPGRSVATVTLRRGHAVWSTKVALIPLRKFLDDAWASSGGETRAVSLNTPTAVRETMYGSYVTGVRWEELHNGTLVVTDILEGSPADRVGLTLGDIIKSVDRNATSAAMAALLRDASSRRRTLDVEIVRNKSARRIPLKSIGISEFLTTLGTRATQPVLQETASVLP